jgi:phosphatidylglycerophosphatase A
MFKFLIKLFASGFGVGYFPFASGTLGTLLGVLIYFLISKSKFFIPIIIILFFFGVYVSTKAEEIYNEKDSHKIVIDEIVGFFIALAFLPSCILYIIVGFLIYRFLDIVKPYPARLFHNFKGGFGIMLDDATVGLYTNLILQVVNILKLIQC